VTAWRWAVLVVGAFAGFAFVAGAVSSGSFGGADLRPDRRTQLADLVSAAQDRVAAQSDQVARLRDEVDAAAVAAGPVLSPAQKLSLAQLTRAAGSTTVRGPGLSVTLTDAPLPSEGLPPGYAPDDYVVHQQDVAAVINALWSAHAQAVTVMDQRLISTSAVRCVGNTLILQGRVYSPPYVITAVGVPEQLQTALDASAQVRDYQRRAQLVGLGYQADAQRVVIAPAYDGTVELQHVAAPAPPGEVR
jgi:uncharacterized protein YlxW (UPF0749 family)